MYLPTQFEEPRIEVMHELIRGYPLATVVVASSTGLNANHIPMHLHSDATPFGALRGHIARANPLVVAPTEDVETLAIFHGPDAYISPSWYATKVATGMVVPTWNYAVVHAYGHLRVIDDAAWLKDQLEAFTDHNEASLPEPWAVSDAPEEFIGKISQAIVGVEMQITRLIGKWKVSQNQPAENRASVVEGLEASGQCNALAMAALVKARGGNS